MGTPGGGFGGEGIRRKYERGGRCGGGDVIMAGISRPKPSIKINIQIVSRILYAATTPKQSRSQLSHPLRRNTITAKTQGDCISKDYQCYIS